jgi:RNA polymerase sigma-70 factor, ECF subfamily
MSSTEPADEELMDRIAHGDADAVRVLYARHGRLVFGLAVHILGDSATAEEVCQDVFMRAWEKSGLYRPDRGKVVTWLARIARNRAIDMLRSRQSRQAGAQQDSGGEEQAAPGEPAADPGERLLQSFREEEVRAAVASLPPGQRSALSLAFFKGMTHREIAQALGEPLGTVKTRIRDAMARLRFILGKGEAEWKEPHE